MLLLNHVLDPNVAAGQFQLAALCFPLIFTDKKYGSKHNKRSQTETEMINKQNIDLLMKNYIWRPVNEVFLDLTVSCCCSDKCLYETVNFILYTVKII